MTRISFYILKGSDENERQVFACRLIEKAYLQGQHIYIHTETAEQASHLNEMLWSFRSDSFVPHELVNQQRVADCPILIGHNASPPRLMNLLINLSPQQPLFFSQFERVAEFINEDEQIKVAGRERYRFYHQRGYELDTFNV
jgi:DNA polymerase-3 subunit chi